jgi:hypothetical protein
VSARVDAAAQAAVAGSRLGASGSTGFRAALERALGSLDRATPSLDATRAGAIDAQSALELQAEVYRYAERVELTSKLVDHTIGAAKTLLQTRV